MHDDIDLLICYQGDLLGPVDGPHEQVLVDAGVECLDVTLYEAQLLLVSQAIEPLDHLIC